MPDVHTHTQFEYVLWIPGSTPQYTDLGRWGGNGIVKSTNEYVNGNVPK